MGITINGSSAAGNIDLGTNGTITDLAVGGLPDGTVDADTLAANAAGTVDIRKDLATLALQTAVDTNRKSYNLTNSFIDQFEDDTGIGSHTTSDRNADEYIETAVTTATAFNFGTAGTHGQPDLRGMTIKQTQLQGATAGNWSNDSVKINDNASYMSSAWPNFLFDTNNDWKFYAANRVGTDGLLDSRGNTTLSVVIFEGTAAVATAAGKAPTYNGSSIFRANAHADVSDETAYDHDANNLDDRVFTSTYATAIATTGFGRVTQTGSNHDTSVNYNTSKSGNGLILSQMWSSTNDNDCEGLYVDYDESASTLVAGFLGSGESWHTNAPKYTVTNVPANARVFCAFGIGNASTLVDYHSLNRGNSKAESSGHVDVVTTNATGNVIGAVNTASSSRTKVSGVMLYKNASGTATIGTDLKIYFTCNGGSNWTEAASYTAGSDFSTGIKTVYLGETTCTAGTDVRYKAEWANQSSGSKETQLHGIGLNY